MIKINLKIAKNKIGLKIQKEQDELIKKVWGIYWTGLESSL